MSLKTENGMQAERHRRDVIIDNLAWKIHCTLMFSQQYCDQGKSQYFKIRDGNDEIIQEAQFRVNFMSFHNQVNFIFLNHFIINQFYYWQSLSIKFTFLQKKLKIEQTIERCVYYQATIFNRENKLHVLFI